MSQSVLTEHTLPSTEIHTHTISTNLKSLGIKVKYNYETISIFFFLHIVMFVKHIQQPCFGDLITERSLDICSRNLLKRLVITIRQNVKTSVILRLTITYVKQKAIILSDFVIISQIIQVKKSMLITKTVNSTVLISMIRVTMQTNRDKYNKRVLRQSIS